MSTIRIKRGSGTPPLLADGEIAYDKSGKSLFVSDGTQNIEFKANPTTANIPDSTNKRYVSDAKLAVLNSTTGTNTGNQTSIVGISGTKVQFNSAVTDGDILYVGDLTQYTDEMAQDAIGNMVTDTSTVRLTYNDGANSMYADVLPDSINSNHLASGIPLSKFVNNVGFEGASELTLRDNANRNRANHTGTQLASTISDFDTASRIAVVEDAIVNGVTNKAPSQNAVFDALNISNQNANTGILYGGGLEVNTDSTKWDLVSGFGYITDTLAGVIVPITWATQSALTTPYLTTAVATYVLITNSGTILLQPTRPTAEQFRTHIYLGKLAHTTLTTILFAITEPVRMFNTAGQIQDINLAIGSINISGNVVTPNGANLNINVSAGSTYRAGANYLTSRNSPSITTEPMVVATSFRRKYRNGTGGWLAVNATTIDSEFYDNGSGTLVTVPNNKFTVMTVWRFGGSGTLHIDYGQTYYDSMDSAINSIGKAILVQDPDNERDASKRGWIITKKGVTTLTDVSTAMFLQAGKFGEIGSTGVVPTLQSTYDNSSTPQITTKVTTGALVIKSGTGNNADKTQIWRNNAGTDVASIDGNGTFTGVSFNGYVPENTANKSNSILDLESTIKFPVWQVVKNWCISQFKAWSLTINNITGITYTISASHNMFKNVFTAVNPITFIVPTFASVNISNGTTFDYTVQGTGTVTVSGAGITFIGKQFSFTTGDTFRLEKTDTDTWSISGGSNQVVSDAEMQSGTDNLKFSTALRITTWFNWRLSQPLMFGGLTGSTSRIMQVNTVGTVSAPYGIIDGFTLDGDVIAAINGATYNVGNNFTASITPASAKVFSQGQWYKNAGYLYFATADNIASRITLS